MKIDKLEIKGKIFLAPMCDVTTLPFRLVCKKYGASVVYTEMINADAYLMNNSKTKKRIYTIDEERPFGIQLMGSTIEKLKLAAIKTEKEYKPDLIDLNFGCPAYNVIKTGSGSALLKDINKVKELISTISSSIKTPLTCKMRILANDKDTILAAKTIQDAGAKLLTIHGRTAGQKYSGKANWDIIKKVKQELEIPVILNGDINDEESANNALLTNVDAIMIGRAAIGNPYIFKRINHYLETGKKLDDETLKNRIDVFFEILELCKKYDYLEIKPIKIFAFNSVKGFHKSKDIKRKLALCKTIKELEELLFNYK